MRANELQFFRDLLLTQRAEILNKTDALRTDPSFSFTSAFESTGQGDEGDMAVSERSISITLQLQERDTKKLIMIDRALAKIPDGGFGFCEQCEEQLTVNRLKAFPVATLCLACKEEQESKERIFA